MNLHFTPALFPDRIIIIDTNQHPFAEKMNCVKCGRLVEVLWKNHELCIDCYEKWSAGFGREWIKEKFG